MSADINDVWQKAADASDEIAYAIAGIPAADVAPGFKHMAETCTELRQAAALLKQALALLQRCMDREDPRYNAYMDRVELN